ncbi:MAG: hypothetical protein RLZZ301_944 [Bacteroidota bacterium]|jgi:thioredoxin-related protein
MSLFNALDHFFLGLGCSFSWAKWLPYLWTLGIGWVLFWIVAELQLKNCLKIGLASLAFALPFSLYFLAYPLYRGDVYTEALKGNPSIRVPAKKCLTMIALPGCPYCEAAIKDLNTIAHYRPHAPIQVMLVSNDDAGARYFRKHLDKRIQLRQANPYYEWIIAAQGSFPSYVWSDHKKVKKVWSNRQFGVRALDAYFSEN